MTAYGAVISLKNTLENILDSSRLSLVGRSYEAIELAYEVLQPLLDTLERLDDTSKSLSRKKVNALDAQIKERLWEFEDLLDCLLSDQILSQIERDDALSFSIDLQYLQYHHLPSFIRALKDMKKEYVYILRNVYNEEVDDDEEEEDEDEDEEEAEDEDEEEEDEDEDEEESYDDDEEEEEEEEESIVSTTSSNMIGLSEQMKEVKGVLMKGDSKKHVHTLFGMAGIGKTILAKKIFEDSHIVRYFDCRVWLAVGRTCQFDQVSRRILDQLDPICYIEGNEAKLRKFLIKRLEGKKCLIVLDDVWEQEVLESLLRSLPNPKFGEIQILITSRDRLSIKFNPFITSTVVPFLKEEESKHLLCDKVFGAKVFPPQLDKAATKIAKRCEGLPLLIVMVGDHLSRSEDRDDPEFWNDVAENRNSVFTDSQNEVSKVLFPSYNYLSQHLKRFFLFLGVFPPDYDIPPSKIINMLTVEGWFHDSNHEASLEDSVFKCLYELDYRHFLVLTNALDLSHWNHGALRRECKFCRLHCSWRHLCRGEARKNKFFHVLNRLVDADSEDIMKGQRGLCLENNMLFGIKDFCELVQCYCASSTRCLFFYGPYHQYPIPIHVDFKLLKELDALKLRFYTFPTEILVLIHLKYLALTCNGEVPPTISKLFNLRVLIIHPHTRIQRAGAPSSIPTQIWDMKELEHIEIFGRVLQVPKHEDVASLQKLSTLVGVNANISTILKLSERIPNIRKLGVEVELRPCDDEVNLLSFFDSISTLESLKTLKCSIINPVANHGYIGSLTPSSLMLQRGLVKLHLSGMGFPWEYMDVIGTLPSLQVLKLRSYAFRGSKWEAREGSFLGLKFLQIENSDLVHWEPRVRSFPMLNCLSFKYCYKLEYFHWTSSDQYAPGNITLVDCNPFAVECAEILRSLYRSTYFVVTISDHLRA